MCNFKIGKITYSKSQSITTGDDSKNKLHCILALVFSSLKIKNYFSYKDPIPDEFDLKIRLKNKEALHINWRKPNLNTQQNHLALTLLLQLPSSLFFSVLVFFPFLFHQLFSLSLTLIIGIFYCFNYTSLLLHLITNTLHHIFVFHLLFSLSLRELLTSFTVLITLRYYFISL